MKQFTVAEFGARSHLQPVNRETAETGLQQGA